MIDDPSPPAPAPLDVAVALLRSPAWQTEAESLLRRLVEISSHTADYAGCQAMADALCDLLRAVPVQVRRDKDPDGQYGDHLFFFTAAAGPPETKLPAGSPLTLLIGHLDTVHAAAAFSGYRESEEGGVRFGHGPGTHDMKGGLVSILLCLRALQQAGLLAGVALRGVVVADEEVGSPTSQRLIRWVAGGASCALGFESGRKGDAIITSRKGVGSMIAHATGKAAHAGNLHHEGHNAIWALSRFVDAAQGLTDYPRGITVNVGRIEGGQGRNIVPDRAQALIDFRFVTHADAVRVEEALDRAAAAASAGIPGTAISLTGGATRAPLERTPASVALYEAYAACQRAAGLEAMESPLLGGGSDASTVAPLGIPAIDGLAPRGSGFHTLAERIELLSILPKAEALLRFLLR